MSLAARLATLAAVVAVASAVPALPTAAAVPDAGQQEAAITINSARTLGRTEGLNAVRGMVNVTYNCDRRPSVISVKAQLRNRLAKGTVSNLTCDGSPHEVDVPVSTYYGDIEAGEVATVDATLHRLFSTSSDRKQVTFT
ncbi:hypothetical protein [Streptomyces alkaliterrae]|uniref:Uncharacterized protein n=1 Tax=Streptomyces alkaliterrae TaxID=2213162 RepID=A0A5P0YT64_9ACTN|nr:hypothetical protein [Streptomyces alkaliterrae]MBB1255517.1 hypothetical protein [Streptomyces alkaliterrae]MBB1260653.1 hypothetical protein [Streptomyces alkaliterrae]MQS03506.1 hypothetical protein [Streptomyces alkaliterrae]